ncbi:MAG: helix-turn-helix transcriptional regulator [Armatimonadetes bacterium]|nr:helix-turn-helix transcriptional regulator [Armatimonadota bacterium]
MKSKENCIVAEYITDDLMGARIKEARNRAHLTQKQLADLLGVTRGTVASYESGVITPPTRSLKRISEVTDVIMPYLLGDVPHPVTFTESDRRMKEMEAERAANLDPELAANVDEAFSLPKEIQRKLADLLGDEIERYHETGTVASLETRVREAIREEIQAALHLSDIHLRQNETGGPTNGRSETGSEGGAHAARDAGDSGKAAERQRAGPGGHLRQHRDTHGETLRGRREAEEGHQGSATPGRGAGEEAPGRVEERRRDPESMRFHPKSTGRAGGASRPTTAASDEADEIRASEGRKGAGPGGGPAAAPAPQKKPRKKRSP